MQPADIAIGLRRRTPWEAMDLGLAMLQRWWRQTYAPHAAVVLAAAAAGWALGASLERPWLALVVVWWLKPLYDRVALHVLSRAVFGEVQGPRAVFRDARAWLGAGLFPYLLLRWWPDLARSFNLPVRQLEDQRGRAGRERRSVLGRRASSYAVWLTVVCLNFELVLYWSFARLASLFLPAKSLEGREFFEAFASGELFSYGDLLAYGAAVLVLEPFYVAAGFALYLNRRTLLEGWDIEVSLRRIAQRHAAALLLVCLMIPLVSFAQGGGGAEGGAAGGTPSESRPATEPRPASGPQRDPRREIAEVLKAPEFPHEVETKRWQRRNPLSPDEPRGERRSGEDWLGGIGYALAAVARVVFWVAAAAALAYALWWAARMLPRGREPLAEPYRPPASLFGMEIAPEALPADVAGAAVALARAGRLREALGLLYRGALSDLVHRRGVELLPSHTEAEALQISLARLPSDRGFHLGNLVAAWRACAYGRRSPALAEVERLAAGYRELVA